MEGAEKVEEWQRGEETGRTQSPRLRRERRRFLLRDALDIAGSPVRVHTRAHLQTHRANARRYRVRGEPAVSLALINNIYLIPVTQNGGGGGWGGRDCRRTEQYIINGCKNETEQSGETKQISSGRFIIETHVEAVCVSVSASNLQLVRILQVFRADVCSRPRAPPASPRV